MFLRKNAHDFLEMIRSQRITSAAVTLQRMVRGFVYRRVFFATRNALLLIQRMSRGMIVSCLLVKFIIIFSLFCRGVWEIWFWCFGSRYLSALSCLLLIIFSLFVFAFGRFCCGFWEPLSVCLEETRKDNMLTHLPLPLPRRCAIHNEQALHAFRKIETNVKPGFARSSIPCELSFVVPRSLN